MSDSSLATAGLDAHPFAEVAKEEELEAIPIEQEKLLEYIRDLPDQYRTVFNLYVFEKMKHKEIADLLKISEGTSKSQLNAAKSKLKELVTTYYYQKAK